MATITEDYVSFEIAKLLKEKGFSENTEHKIWYVIKQFSTGCHWNSCTYKVGDTTREYDEDCCIPMPTLQMAMKWLREVYNLYIELNWEKGNQLYSFQIWKPKKFQPEISSLDLWKIYKDDNYLGEWIYEEACKEAIKYCLENLI